MGGRVASELVSAFGEISPSERATLSGTAVLSDEEEGWRQLEQAMSDASAAVANNTCFTISSCGISIITCNANGEPPGTAPGEPAPFIADGRDNRKLPAVSYWRRPRSLISPRPGAGATWAPRAAAMILSMKAL